MTASRPMPGNADVRHCKWYDGDTHGRVEVHLWGLPVPTVDSVNGEGWAVRKCVMCGIPDEQSLMAQFEHYEKVDGRETTEGP